MSSDSFIGEGLTPTPYREAMCDLGDPQFWIDRRVACISAGYPPSEADYVSIQEYVKKLEEDEDTVAYVSLRDPKDIKRIKELEEERELLADDLKQEQEWRKELQAEVCQLKAECDRLF
jgi:hypothetical protein